MAKCFQPAVLEVEARGDALSNKFVSTRRNEDPSLFVQSMSDEGSHERLPEVARLDWHDTPRISS